MSILGSEDCKGIGFNDEVQWGQRSFHVQTEVVGRDAMKVRSTVLEGGVVRFATSHPFPVEVGDFAGARAYVEAQHQATLTKVSRGEIE